MKGITSKANRQRKKLPSTVQWANKWAVVVNTLVKNSFCPTDEKT